MDCASPPREFDTWCPADTFLGMNDGETIGEELMLELNDGSVIKQRKSQKVAPKALTECVDRQRLQDVGQCYDTGAASNLSKSKKSRTWNASCSLKIHHSRVLQISFFHVP